MLANINIAALGIHLLKFCLRQGLDQMILLRRHLRPQSEDGVKPHDWVSPLKELPMLGSTLTLGAQMALNGREETNWPGNPAVTSEM